MLFFPHETIRPVQDQFIKRVSQALSEKKNLIVHAPTGLGKTAATLAPAITFAVDKDLTIFFLTARHTQHKIVLDTIKEIKEKFSRSLESISIIGKKSMCALDQASALPSSDFNHYCRHLCEIGGCEFYVNFKNNGIKAEYTLNALKTSSPNSSEQVISHCKKEKLCPYEISIAAARTAKVVICDYSYIFNPFIREIFLKKCDKKLENLIIIVDESHNLPARIREMMSDFISEKTLQNAFKEAEKYGLDNAGIIVSELKNLFVKISKELALNQEKLVDFNEIFISISKIGKYDEIVEELKKYAELIRENDRKSSIGSIADFLDLWQISGDHMVRIAKKEDKNMLLTIKCLDASVLASKVFSKAYSTILMSGTLTPTIMYGDLLGISNVIYDEFPSPFPEKNKLSIIIPRTTTKFTSRTDLQFENIAEICTSVINIIQGCSVCFFPSYYLRDKISFLIETKCNKTVFYEQKNMAKEEKQELLERFKTYRDSGAVLFAVANGSFGEGIDLPGLLKSVIVVGLPLDKPDLETQQKIQYYDKKTGNGFEYGYTLPAITTCFQNAGRCIRSENDRGVIIFLDERYAWPRYRKYFPQEWNTKVTLDYLKEIKEFFT